jgi:DNA-binding transcriptional LysR family regulator
MRRSLDTGLFHAMRLFVRVADARRMTAAAAQSNLTTALISRMMTELERRHETKLIQRNSRNLTLTAAGENYLLRCREVLDLVAEAEGEAAGVAEQPVGNLRVMCITGFGRRYVRQILQN